MRKGEQTLAATSSCAHFLYRQKLFKSVLVQQKVLHESFWPICVMQTQTLAHKPKIFRVQNIACVL